MLFNRIYLSTFLTFLFFLFFFFGCSQNEKVNNQTEETFFDLQKFIQSEQINVELENCRIIKKGEIKGESSTASIKSEDFDWTKEFKILSDMNIRKSAWYSQFEIDTTFVNSDIFGETVQISYSTQNDKIPIKNLLLIFNQHDYSRPLFVEAERKIKNWIFESEQKVQYTSGKELYAEGFLSTLGMNKKTFKISTAFICTDD